MQQKDPRKSSFSSENEIRIIMLGLGSVGKSSVTIRLINQDFSHEYNPTLQEKFRKSLMINEKPVNLGKTMRLEKF